MSTPKEKIARLQRRADHLSKRIANTKDDLTFDKAELSALLWAIEELSKPQDDYKQMYFDLLKRYEEVPGFYRDYD